MKRKAFALIATVSLLLPLLISYASVAEIGSPGVAVIASGNPGGVDWPMFGRFPNRTSNTPVQALTNGSIWELKTAIDGATITPGNLAHTYWGGDWRLLSSPVVIYNPDRAKWVVYYGSNDFYFYCLDANEGTVIWKTQVGSEVNPEPAPGNYRDRKCRSTPAVVLNSTGKYVAYVTTSGRQAWATGNPDNRVMPCGAVTALEAFDGKVLWNTTTVNLLETSPVVVYSPPLSKQVVYQGWNRPRSFTPLTNPDATTTPIHMDGGVIALDADTGALIWNKTLSTLPNLNATGFPGKTGYETEGGMVIGRGPAVSSDNSTIYITAFNGRVTDQAGFFKEIEGWVIALDADDGGVQWIVKMDNRGWSSPTVVGDVVYVGWGYNNLTITDTTPCYSVTGPRGPYGPFGGVVALNRLNGNVIWNSSQYWVSGGPIDSSPAYYHNGITGMVIVGGSGPTVEVAGEEEPSTFGYVYCLDADDGTLIWNYTAMGDVRSSPAVGGGIVYVGDLGKDYVYALNANTTNPEGELVWIYKLRSNVKGSPAVALVETVTLALKPIVYITAEELDTRQGQTLYAIGMPVKPNVRAEKVTLSRSSVAPGDIITANVTVGNVGEKAQSIAVKLYLNSSTLGEYVVARQIVIGVPSLSSMTVTFTIDTTYYPVGIFTTLGEACTVAGEIAIADNIVTGPTLTIAYPAAVYTYDWPRFHYDLAHIGVTQSLGPLTNKTIWQYDTGGTIYQSIAVKGNVTYVGNNNNEVEAHNRTTGALIWSYTTAGDVRGIAVEYIGGLGIDVVYAADMGGYIHALNATDGTQIWNHSIGGAELFCEGPTVSGNVVYFGSTDDNLTALNATTGALIWNYSTGGDVERSAPAVVGSVVYVGSHGGPQPGTTTFDPNGTAQWFPTWVNNAYVKYGLKSIRLNTGLYNETLDVCGGAGVNIGSGVLNITEGGGPIPLSSITLDSDFKVWAYLDGTAVSTNASYPVYYPYFNFTVEFFNTTELGSEVNTTTIGGIGSWTVSGNPANNTWQQFQAVGGWYNEFLVPGTNRLNSTTLSAIKSALNALNSTNAQKANITVVQVRYGCWGDGNYSAVYGVGYQAINWTIYVDDVTVLSRTFAVENTPKVFAVNTDGTLKWASTVPMENCLSSPTVVDEPTLGKKVVYIGSNDNNVYCLDAANGARIWNSSTPANVLSTAAYKDGRIFIGCHAVAAGTPTENMYCLNAATGAKIWGLTTLNNVMCAPAVTAAGIVYFGSNDGTLWAVSETDGAVLWLHNDTQGRARRGVVVADGVAYACMNQIIMAIGVQVGPAPDLAVIGATPRPPQRAPAVFSSDPACKWNATVLAFVENQGNTAGSTVTFYYFGGGWGAAQNTTGLPGPINLGNLQPANATTLNITWIIGPSRVVCSKYNYTGNYYAPYYLTTTITTLNGETDTADNQKSGTLVVRFPGDASGDGKATGTDLGILGRNWYKKYGDVGYDEMADFSGDYWVTGTDLGILGRNWFRQASSLITLP